MATRYDILSHDRIRRHTAPEVNDRIDQRIEDSIRLYRQAPRELLDRRIDELEREWDIDRGLMVNLGVIGLAALARGIGSSRRWLALPVIQLGFLIYHAAEGWCPPMPVFRRLGWRTEHEIGAELAALKALRGDFEVLDEAKPVSIETHAAQPEIGEAAPTAVTWPAQPPQPVGQPHPEHLP
jgi:hypothetical protein